MQAGDKREGAGKRIFGAWIRKKTKHVYRSTRDQEN